MTRISFICCLFQNERSDIKSKIDFLTYFHHLRDLDISRRMSCRGDVWLPGVPKWMVTWLDVVITLSKNSTLPIEVVKQFINLSNLILKYCITNGSNSLIFHAYYSLFKLRFVVPFSLYMFIMLCLKQIQEGFVLLSVFTFLTVAIRSMKYVESFSRE